MWTQVNWPIIPEKKFKSVTLHWIVEVDTYLIYPYTKFESNIMNGFRETSEHQTLNITPKAGFNS